MINNEVANWKFNESAGTTPAIIKDSASNHLDLTVIGSPLMMKVYK